MDERIHVRPVGGLRVPFPNGRVLPAGGALVKRTLFVERRLAANEIEIVPASTTSEAGSATTAAASSTTDDEVQNESHEEHGA